MISTLRWITLILAGIETLALLGVWWLQRSQTPAAPPPTRPSWQQSRGQVSYARPGAFNSRTPYTPQPRPRRIVTYLAAAAVITWLAVIGLFVLVSSENKDSKIAPTGTQAVEAPVSPEVSTVIPTETVPPTKPPTVAVITDTPAEPPTAIPTEPPTNTPTAIPTEPPTEPPTNAPTAIPTEPPTEIPTDVPTDIPAPTSTPVPVPAPVERVRQNILDYDANGNIKTLIDPAGSLISYDYDTLNQLTAVTYPDGSSVSYSYDRLNRLSTISDSLGTTSYTYDIHGRIEQVTDPNNRTFRYRYDARGLIAQMSYPGGASVSYTWDSNGWLTAASDSTAGQTSYTYDLAGRLTERTLPNGVVTQFEYDPAGFLSAIRHLDPNGTSLLEMTYVFDAGGNCTEMTVPGQPPRTTRYRYDAVQRLIEVVYPDGEVVSYEYDAGGNRTQMKSTVSGTTRYTYDPFGQLIALETVRGRTDFQYDPNGNLIRRQDTDGHTITYTWDYENRLIAVDDGVNRVQYGYDGEGRRLFKAVNGRITEYAQQGTGWSQVLLTEGDYAARVIMGAGQVGEITAGSAAYYLEDGLGSVIGLTDGSGHLIDTTEYDAFGLPRTPTPLPALFAFAGEEMDAETGLIYLRARYYDPALGRFLSPDPFPLTPGETQAMNRYTYARNNPASRIDPTGLQDGSGWLPTWLRWVPPVANFFLFGWVSPDYSVTPNGMANVSVTFLKAWNINAAQIGFSFPVPGRIENPQNWLAQGYNLTRGYLLPFMAPYMVTGFSLASEKQAIMESAWNTLDYSFFNHPFQTAPASARPVVFYGFDRPINPEILTRIQVEASACSLRYDSCVYKPTYLKPFDPDEITDPVLRKYGYPMLGGVDLNRSAEVLVDLNEITGAVFDQHTGQLVLIGRKNLALPSMSMDDLAVAVRTIYGGQNPTMSIEPCQAGVQNGCMRVHYNDRFAANPTASEPQWVSYNAAGQLAPMAAPATWNNHFGWVMFEADRYLKAASLGTDNLTGEAFQTNVPGYTSLLDLSAQQTAANPNYQVGTSNQCMITSPASRNQPSSCYRMWFVPGEIVVNVSDDGRTMTFEDVTITTEARFVRFEPSGKMVDVPGNDPAVNQFVAFMNTHYVDLAQEKPELAELIQLAKIAGIVRWLYDNDLPVDISWVDRYEVPPVDTPLSTQAIQVQTTTGNTIIGLYGGVDLTKPPTYQTDPAADQLASFVLDTRPSATDLTWTFDYEGETLQAVALNLAPSAIVGGYSLSQTDISLPVGGQLAAEFTRAYNSLDPAPSPYGRGWSLEIPTLISQHTPVPGESDAYRTELVLTLAGAETATFTLSSEGIFIPKETMRETQILGLTGEDPFAPGQLPDGWSLDASLPGEPIGLYDQDYNPVTYTGFALISQDMTYTFNTYGQLTGARDLAGHELTYTYSGEDIVAIADQDGFGINFAYNDDHRLTTINTTDGQTRQYSYGPNGELEQVSDGQGTPINVYRYDYQGHLTQIEDGAGRILATLSYDELGRVTSSSGANQITYTDTNTVTYTNPEGFQVVRQYDERGQIRQETDSMGRTRTFDYDDQGRVTRYTDYAGSATQIAYDQYGFITTITGPQGTQTQFLTHDMYGQPLSIVDPDNNLILLDTNEYGQLTQVQAGLQMGDFQGGSFTYLPVDPLTTTYSYNMSGQVEAIQDPSSLTTRLGYDASGNLSSIQMPGGAAVTSSYDTRGRLVNFSDATGNTTALTYDDQDRVLTMTLPGSRTYQYAYTAGQLTSLTDPGGGTTTYQYNEAGQLSAVTDAIGATTTYQYNRQGQLVLIQPPVGGSIRLNYDVQGRLIQQQQNSPPSASQIQQAVQQAIQVSNLAGWPEFKQQATGRVTPRQ